MDAGIPLPALEALEERSLMSVTVTINYSLDTNNFFNTQAKKDVLELAAAHVSAFLNDSLDAITPGGVNSWSAKFTHPGSGVNDFLVANPTVAANEVLLFAGGRNLGTAGGGGFVLGVGGPGGFNASGTASWLNTVQARGEAGALLADPNDFGPWGGAISFTTNTGVNFNFGPPSAPLGAGETSFFAVAVHELMHMFGFGASGAWSELVNGSNQFTGAAAQAEHDLGGPIALAPGSGHWADGTTESGQPTMMDPTISSTVRYLTQLDVAALDDIGWEILNQPPVAVNDNYTVALSGTTSVTVANGVLINDTDFEGDSLTAVLVDNVDFGTLTLSPNGSFNYTPGAGFAGFDTFTYRASDGSGNSNIATVTLGSIYPITTKLLASDGAAGDEFGINTAIWGKRAIVGSWHDDDNGSSSGAVYVYEQQLNNSWLQVDKIKASDAAGGHEFGHAVSMTGDRFIVGSQFGNGAAGGSGAAYIYERQGDGTWKQIKIFASDGAGGDSFSHGVAIYGDTAVVGAYEDDDAGGSSGSAYVFQRQADGTWVQVQKLTASDAQAGDFFGSTVSLGDGRVVIGAMRDDDMGTDAGSAYIFERNGSGVWVQVLKLKASDGAAGDEYGRSLSLCGDRIVIGSWLDNETGSNSGTAYIYERQAGGTWLEKKLTPIDPTADAQFGESVSISGNIALVTARQHVSGGTQTTGVAYAFQRQADGTWAQYRLVAFDGAAGDAFGLWAHVAGERALIGAMRDDDNGGDAGSAYIHQFSGTNNKAPIAMLDSYLSSGGAINATTATGVLANDTDANLNALTAALVDDVDNGSLTFNPDGSFSYTPTAGFHGVDTFTYRVSDGTANSNTVTVSLNVVLGMAVSDVSVAEGNSGLTDLTFTVTLAEASAQTVTVNYTTSNGTATAPADYLSASGLLTFDPGQLSRTVTISVAGDQTVELDETITFTLSNANNATIVDGTATGTITNDDVAVITINDASMAEGNTGNSPLTFTVTLSKAVDTNVTLLVNTANGTATVANNDYNPVTNQTVTFTAGGALTQLVNVNIVGDSAIEPNETFSVNLSGLSAGGRAVTISDASGTGTIHDDDLILAPTVTVTSVTINSDAVSDVTGFFDVFFDVPPEVQETLAAYNLQLSISPIGAITFTGAAEPDNAIFPGQTPNVFRTGNTIQLSDDLPAQPVGEAAIIDDMGVARILFRVPAGTEGVFDVTIDVVALFDGEGNDVVSRTVNGQITVIADSIPPVVQSVQVDGTAWNALFPHVDGYTMPTGVDQLKPLPWFNVNQVRIAFSEHVDIAMEDLFVRGVNVTDYAVSGFEYDENTFTATWTLATAVNTDKLLIGFTRVIEDQFGNQLDGEWANGTAGEAYPSGDGTAGGDFQYRINVLPGDVTQNFAIQGNDLILVRNAQFQPPGSAGYNAFYDVNASGSILGGDVILVRNRQFTILPSGEPTPPVQPLISSGDSVEPLAVTSVADVGAILTASAAAIETAPLTSARPKHGVPWSPKWIETLERADFSVFRFDGHAGSLVSDLVELKPLKTRPRGPFIP